jgi:outer membrane lipoprotein
MRRLSSLLIAVLLTLYLTGCTVISRQRMAEALTDVTFAQLHEQPDRYRGQVVILGGQVIEVRNQADQTLMVILQSPLGSGQEPQPPERSQGRFILRHDGFLDPEIYAKGRAITTAGRVVGRIREPIGEVPYDYPLLEALEIYLWAPEAERYPYRPYHRPWYYDPWYDRHPWRGYPYGW